MCAALGDFPDHRVSSGTAWRNGRTGHEQCKPGVDGRGVIVMNVTTKEKANAAQNTIEN